LNEALLPHIEVGLLVEEVPVLILELLLHVGPELRLLGFSHQFLMEGQGVTDGCDIFEVDSVGYLETLHAISMPPLLKMHLECPSTPVAVISADLALVLYAQTVKLVEPIRYRLSVPTKRKILRIVNGSICFLFRLGL
jgi:hypothetical protein